MQQEVEGSSLMLLELSCLGRQREKYCDAHAVTTVSGFSMFLQSAKNLFECTEAWTEVASCYTNLALTEGGNTQKSHISVTEVPAKFKRSPKYILQHALAWYFAFAPPFSPIES